MSEQPVTCIRCRGTGRIEVPSVDEDFGAYMVIRPCPDCAEEPFLQSGLGILCMLCLALGMIFAGSCLR
jgi:hypothetical protein